VGYLGQSTFGGTIEALKRGDADRALLPVENTTAGPISGVYDLLVEPGLHIVGEEVLKVEHCLLGLPGATLADIRHIGTHPQAIRQSSLFLDAFKSDGGHVEDEGDTAGAAKAVAEKGDKTRAAIAGEDAAERYGLHVLKRNIANRKDNFTRFLIVATEPHIIHQMEKALPGKTFIGAPGADGNCNCNICPYMALNTLEKLYTALRDLTPQIEIEEGLRLQAKHSLDRMLEMASGTIGKGDLGRV